MNRRGEKQASREPVVIACTDKIATKCLGHCFEWEHRQEGQKHGSMEAWKLTKAAGGILVNDLLDILRVAGPSRKAKAAQPGQP